MAAKTQKPTASIEVTKILLIIIGILLAIMLVGAGFYLGNNHNQITSLTPTIFPQQNTTSLPTQATTSTKRSVISSGPNPASAFCTQQGGRLSIQARGDGGQYGLCTFEDNLACEEWAMFRGECPIGGVKTTGFENVQQNYCAWSGGKTLAVTNATCTFSNGKVCDALAYYNGTCKE